MLHLQQWKLHHILECILITHEILKQKSIILQVINN